MCACGKQNHQRTKWSSQMTVFTYRSDHMRFVRRNPDYSSPRLEQESDGVVVPFACSLDASSTAHSRSFKV